MASPSPRLVQRLNPALVTADTARRLPRWVPWVLMAAYILPGFLGRDPWRTQDLSAFAVMLDMHRGGPWWTPEVLGAPADALAWLPYWLGALALSVLPLPAELAVRVPFAGLLGLTLAATWYATYHLAREPAAQPLSLAFGGEAHPADYARALADGALLVMVATLGLAMLAHEATPTAAQLGFAALVFYAVALGLRSPRNAALVPGWMSVALWWAGVWGWALSGGPVPMLVVSAAGAWWWWRSGHPARVWGSAALGSLGAAGAAFALALAADRAIELIPLRLGAWSNLAAWQGFGRLLAWFLWPAAAFALWTLWRWRGRWREPHIGWPATAAALAVGITFLNGGDDRSLLLALPPLAALAAFALPTLRRSVSALVDWFAVLFFTGAATLVWLIWIAMQTGIPPKPAANIARLLPGFEPTLDARLVLPALVATAAWIGAVAWRLGRCAPALWRGVVLSASGLTLNWVLLMTLWLPLLNYGLGQAPVSQRMAALVAPGDCVLVHGLDAARIAGLQHHGGLQVWRLGQPDAPRCRWLVAMPADFPGLARKEDLSDWQLRTELPRLRENRERWLVFERRSEAPAQADGDGLRTDSMPNPR
ncbi:MAG: hypothetical protein P3W97_001885 [Tepidimonas sp.]|uniref:hypothetical protein n=1 Tax=Tepidimonas sp. TaxID=2002775 RepID=UPI00259F42D6|nr:hypothetical protein [Tepidimonas sp.]MDM7456032.1 hypothetical protein [Tepidimonas sp.]